jgi:hypothetical protein
MRATDLERTILDWIAHRHREVAPRLLDIEIVSRQHSGAGLYIYLADEGPDWDRPPLDGPGIDSPQLEQGAGCLLWLSDGEPNCLEVYAFGDTFPASLQVFELSAGQGNEHA